MSCCRIVGDQSSEFRSSWEKEADEDGRKHKSKARRTGVIVSRWSVTAAIGTKSCIALSAATLKPGTVPGTELLSIENGKSFNRQGKWRRAFLPLVLIQHVALRNSWSLPMSI